MEDLSRTEYPAMLASLQPSLAVQVLQGRVRRIGKINTEIADWLQERRRVEEQYVAGLKKLAQSKVPGVSSELGVFQPTWDAVLRSADTIANAHHAYCKRIEADVEAPLRTFQTKKDMTNMTTISNNLQNVARTLDDAHQRVDKLSKKNTRAAQKMDVASAQLESATQQWESQAPFVFETLQALDEQRVNQLRDMLTQLETHEVEKTSQSQSAAEAMLNLILEIKTSDEIDAFVQRTVASRAARIERRNTRTSSVAEHSSTPSTAQPPPLQTSGTVSLATPAPAAPHDDNGSEHSARNEPPPPTESKLRSRIGTMLGRRRQSVYGFGQLSPSKNSGPFSRISHSSHGRTVSPRTSSHNLADASHRLSSLAETPDTRSMPPPPSAAAHVGTTNGVRTPTTAGGAGGAAASLAVPNGSSSDDLYNVPPPPGPPPSRQLAARSAADAAAPAHPQPNTDAEGFSVPAPANDPISEAQREASAALGSGEEDHAFKLNIQTEPVPEEDAAEKQAALSSVANTLSMAMPSRKTGTVRGRRDARNTIYVPAAPPLAETSTSLSSVTTSSPATLTQSPTFSSVTTPTRHSALAALASEASLGASDAQSVRSAASLSSLSHIKHVDATTPGLSASIIETVSATFAGGELQTAKIAGEIAFSYNADPLAPAGTETVRIDNAAQLEVLGPNRIFVQNTAAADEFTLATTHLQPKATVGFTFRAHATDATSLGAHCPLVLKPVWKLAGDKLNLVLQYRRNAATGSDGPLTLRNVVMIATYADARASGVQTKPTGTHLKDKHLVYWRLGEVILSDVWSKIVCRVVGEAGAVPQPGHIEARWEYTALASTAAASGGLAGTDIRVSRLAPATEGEVKGKGALTEGPEDDEEEEEEEDPFADESGPPKAKTSKGSSWTELPLARQIVSGRYEA